ncbi:uncharacterized protein F5Z01DRAFT_636252 [Emericellopsis atlantica]|uniref:DUF4267 domain-containing protein n=1 Tax=Emericellopsis atlantica TaxID=2614577 RepID=A0A9P8CQ08_9HYPO|nr:uncharacterized protein F5Z01DRAFT_636252 [Emericellopsis atlantica]KAG9254787.1 hypothetical protein F5Z01DRAFT_636252 [Emericellopsis atlantica]
MNHPYIFNATAALSTVLMGFGLSATFRPDGHLRSLGFPVHTEPTAKKLNSALMSIWGIRNISVSLLLFLIWAQKDESLMAKAMGIVIAIPFVDGFVSRRLIGYNEMMHWSFIPILGITATGLSL